ncbi:HAD-like protein [Backusella circina FSU 941]|nr:HAD-like protein [Backusella circina FSU 941]
MSNILKSRGFLFDLDGTMIDTTPLVIEFWENIAKEYNLDAKKILESSHGRRTIETLQKWIPEKATPEYVNELEIGLAAKEEGVTILPGVLDMLSHIDSSDWTINTAGTMIMATSRLQQCHIPIPQKMSTGDMLSQGKPHPEGYLRAAEFIGKKAEDCIVFEDAPAGVIAARAAGMECIACVTTHTVDQLREAGATFIVTDFTDVHIKKQEDGSYITSVENIL